jgi:hypothetical protein
MLLEYPRGGCNCDPHSAATDHGELAEPRSKKAISKQFSGVWRAALELDSGKDLPTFCEHEHEVPGKVFFGQLAKAFGTPRHHVGFLY